MFEQNGVQTGFADINGGRLYYEVAGDGPVLVLAHAGIADRRMWDDQFLFFAQHFRVIRFDFWGFGKSSIAKNSFFFVLSQTMPGVETHLIQANYRRRRKRWFYVVIY